VNTRIDESDTPAEKLRNAFVALLLGLVFIWVIG
jgi:hypothetical protein